MKTMILNFFRAIVSFIQANTAVAVVTASAVVVTAVAVPVGVHAYNSSRTEDPSISSGNIKQEETIDENITDENDFIDESESVTPTPEPTPEVTATPEPEQNVTPEPTAKPTNKPTAKPTAKPTQKPSGPTVVQKANPETGISWDGKSPIIYTYPDGTTGTEKRVGAKYEAYPGVIYTIEQADVATPTPSSPVQTSICSDCGKPDGDGTNGTCVQWLMKDVDCPRCGEHVQVRTCHTCGQ